MKNNIYFIVFLVILQVHAMELQEIVIEGKQEEQEVEESRVFSLKLLAAKSYAEKYKKLPEQAVPKECIPYIKLYLPITEDSIYEQYALAREFGDHKRKEEIEKKLIEYNDIPMFQNFFLYAPKEELKVQFSKYNNFDELPEQEVATLQEHIDQKYKKKWKRFGIVLYCLIACSGIFGGLEIYCRFYQCE